MKPAGRGWAALAGLLFVALLVAACAPGPALPPRPAAGQGAWEFEIQEFEQADREQPPPPGGVLFVGSSSIGLWTTLAEDFAGVPVLNRGFGGAAMGDVVRYAGRIVVPCRPRMVVLYAGENDIVQGRTPAQVLAAYRTFVERIHRELPQTRIAFISIKPSPRRWHLAAPIRQANALVQAYTLQDPRRNYIDVFTAMLDGEGRPRGELFTRDGLHLNASGYRLWRAAVLPHLQALP